MREAEREREREGEKEKGGEEGRERETEFISLKNLNNTAEKAQYRD